MAVAAARHALLVRARRRKREGPGGVRRGDRVQLIPAEVDARLEGVAPARIDDRIHHLPHRRLVRRERARRRTQLLEPGKREQRQRIVERRIGGNARVCPARSMPCRPASVPQSHCPAAYSRRGDRSAAVAVNVCVSLKTACWPSTWESPTTPPVPITEPVTAPLPSGSGVTGCSTSEK